ncbi:GAF and ANTAR domain-containing protein [Kribbella sp. NPDC023972]|uniref:GAF and ANTAR domain-containing protein n=1 Tax=Kribbella sp. NPDC023972 TaxID=3154795 RepID=UPI0033EB3C46
MTSPAADATPQPPDAAQLDSAADARWRPILDEDRWENLVVELHEALDLQQTMDRFLAFAVDFLACDHATIALRHRARITVGAATDEASHAALLAQLDCGEGPSLTAISTGLSVLVSDTERETRWPLWAARVTARGRSIFAIPLTAAGSTFGALTLIGEHPHSFDAEDAKAPRVATYGAVAIAAAKEHDSLVEAVHAGQLIGQAVGMLRERFSIDDSRAFDILKRHSQDSNTRLREVAQHLLTTGHLPTTNPPTRRS